MNLPSVRFSCFSDPCEKVDCSHGAACVRKIGGPECVCQVCDPEVKTQFVCGSDARTYPSYCHLKYAACKRGTDIKLVKSSPCGKFSIT